MTQRTVEALASLTAKARAPQVAAFETVDF